jgi:hypothetical protein
MEEAFCVGVRRKPKFASSLSSTQITAARPGWGTASSCNAMSLLALVLGLHHELLLLQRRLWIWRPVVVGVAGVSRDAAERPEWRGVVGQIQGRHGRSGGVAAGIFVTKRQVHRGYFGVLQAAGFEGGRRAHRCTRAIAATCASAPRPWLPRPSGPWPSQDFRLLCSSRTVGCRALKSRMGQTETMTTALTLRSSGLGRWRQQSARRAAGHGRACGGGDARCLPLAATSFLFALSVGKGKFWVPKPCTVQDANHPMPLAFRSARLETV